MAFVVFFFQSLFDSLLGKCIAGMISVLNIDITHRERAVNIL